MVWVGVDAHKKVVVAVAVDETGQVSSRFDGGNTPRDWQRFSGWLGELGEVVSVGIEGAYSYGRGLAQWLVGSGLTVYDINPRWTAAYRRTARRQHKTDPLDARAVALVVLRDRRDLPQVLADDVSSVLQLLVAERDSALAESVRLRNQLHVHFFQLSLEVGTIHSAAGLHKLLAQLLEPRSALDDRRIAVIKRLAERCFLAFAEVERYAAEIEVLAKEHFAPLTRIHGVGLLTAGVIASQLGPGSRFLSEAQVAAYAGVAPLEASSAGHTRHRLNRSGNRKLNAAIYFIALSQLRSPTSPGRAYIDKRRAQGKTLREALRALKRFIARAIFQAWRECLSPQSAPVQLVS